MRPEMTDRLAGLLLLLCDDEGDDEDAGGGGRDESDDCGEEQREWDDFLSALVPLWLWCLRWLWWL